MKSRALALFLAVALVSSAAGAQNNLVGLTYNFSFPAVDLKDYVGQNSWYGFTFDYRHQLPSRPNVSIGVSSGWYVFYNNVNKLIELENGAISGEQYRNFNIVPILANAHYYFGTPGAVRPYLGLNVGAYWAQQQLDISLYSVDESNWHFGLAPEAGVAFPIEYNTNLFVNARYHYLFSAGEYLDGSSMTLPFFTLGVGVAWRH